MFRLPEVALFTNSKPIIPATQIYLHILMSRYLSVAELMQPLAIKGQLSGSFNDAGTGIYYYTSANQNGPGGNYGFLISIYYNGTKLQIAGWAGGDSGLKCRNWYLGGIWSDWRAL